MKVLTFLLIALPLLLPLLGQTYDIVIQGGRAIDPETNLEAIRDIGINAGRIAVISETSLAGKRVIRAKGLIVAPGFIDLHAHGQDLENQRYQVSDGVTTALELEIGTAYVSRWYREREGKRLINSGVSAGHVPNRMEVMRDPNPALFVPSGPASHHAATEEEIVAMKRRLAQGIAAGALGVGFGIQYTPAASRAEILEMFRVAGRAKAPPFVHARHMGSREPQSALNAVEEVIAASTITGAPLHIVHISSNGLQSTPVLLSAIADARTHGLDVMLSVRCRNDRNPIRHVR